MLLPLTATLLLVAPPAARASDISREVLGSFRNFLPAAFGDYNGDKQTDLFVLDPDRHGLEIALMFHANTPMLRRRNLRCVYGNLTLQSLVPSDFDGDGAMDLLVVAKEATAGGPHDLLAFVLWGDTRHLPCGYNISIELRGQPLAVDYDGDMVTDLFGQSRNGSRVFWVFGRDRTVRRVVLDHADAAPLRLPHASAFVDVTGDLAADLVVATEAGFEEWEHGDAGWALRRSLPLPPGVVAAGQSAFFDVDSDGRLEHLVPVCFDAPCANSSVLVARADGGWARLLLEAEDPVHGRWGFVAPADDVYREVITPRVGDFNLDGYPDLLMSLERKDGEVTLRRSFLLRNVPCAEKPACGFSRGFRAEWDTFAGYPDSPAAAFYDLSDDGLLDAFVVHRVDGQYTVSAVRNSPDYDALFLKVIVLDGGCFNNCSFGIHIPYGTNKPGPAMLGRMTLIDGSIWSFAAAQLSLSGHHALQLPYTVLGLGRSPNFVDDLKIGVPRVSHAPGPLTQQWTQLIPNSQLIVVPHPPAQPSRWVNKLYVTPGQTIMATLAALLGTLAVTLVIIGLLHWRERRQDRRERMQEAHRFNFDAM
ncbi:T-cell immunomodulatory protein-like [Pollicipes pollicipes]|uniref:T-cell immunomodulatory protein-like n=1 Tax=Pollicipes pollicipes TaxID=41117 RepID=UPI001884FE7F|nr:T-cell immunomodulatory protein-like [Pollicipes pollicipes]XP_037085233.1 T-cell immunomodulatory protein-like [Pollicipes pollicipes]XP_037085235.1 T-cell immunomodulatory protein-like [Pollicipes pollicipes]XP_037085236.1 T-cell immunomodulatory protein-like [Pollicipes pollicipes]XP_037085237.1 T-cell immunomodulatory protein-like [Pollicipes pollicipes]XP_037085238.1 T-cell immunomodulatory protein-like [Pollicipes pollicipes]XP_037085239.1 T-cell immunomodulatory protein-like [Pollic